MKTYSKEHIEAFVSAYNQNIAYASEGAVRAFLRDYIADVEWDQLQERHEYACNIFDALCLFNQGMEFNQEAKGGRSMNTVKVTFSSRDDEPIGTIDLTEEMSCMLSIDHIDRVCQQLRSAINELGEPLDYRIEYTVKDK